MVEPALFDGSVPMHHQVYLVMRDELADGLWWGRSDFPGEKDLAEQFGISVITSRAALKRLADDGWIQRHRGKRTVVIRPDGAARPFSPSLVPVGPFPRFAYRLLQAPAVATAPSQACAAFGMAAGSELWQCKRLRSHEGRAHSVTHSVQLPAVGQRHAVDGLNGMSMVKLLRLQGLTVTKMRRWMSTSIASPIVAAALGLTAVQTVLVATLTLQGEDDEIMEWVRIHLHPEFSTPEETMDLVTGSWSAAAPP